MSSLLPQYCRLHNNEKLSECKWTRNDRATNITHPSAGGSPGEFHVTLHNGIVIKFAATDHAAIYHFDYSSVLRPASQPIYPGSPARLERAAVSKTTNISQPILTFDHLTDLRGSGGREPNNTLRTSNFTIPAPPSSQPAISVTRIETSAMFWPSFGVGNYTVYTCLDVPYAADFTIYHQRVSDPTSPVSTKPRSKPVSSSASKMIRSSVHPKKVCYPCAWASAGHPPKLLADMQRLSFQISTRKATRRGRRTDSQSLEPSAERQSPHLHRRRQG